MAKRKVTDEMKAEMNRLRHEEGMSCNKIAGKFGISGSAVRRWTDIDVYEYYQSYGRKRHKDSYVSSTKSKFSGFYPEETKQKARDLREQGWTYKAIALEIGCSEPSVRRWCDPEAAEYSRQKMRDYLSTPEGREKHRQGNVRYKRERAAVDPEWAERSVQKSNVREWLDATGRTKILFERQNGICPLCDQPLPEDYMGTGRREIDADHIMPTSLGGELFDMDNLQLTHYSCNRSKGNRI